ncbi:hypothetical protein [Parasitella parasitica]|uniref:HMA domain-containing protein n=1 Tax=Parasitella parasitica TaxID=35722 RepID=A0A0B7NIK2_9FUNG|nr:hypothetical protein [Parasitella parasitica]
MNRYTVKVKVTGMTCNHCVNTITKALGGFPGINSSTINVSLQDSLAFFSFEDVNNKTVSELQQDISELVQDLGYDTGTPILTALDTNSNDNKHSSSSSSNTLAVSASVTGMTCSHCTSTIEKALGQLPFIDAGSVQVSLDDELATMQFINPDDSITKDRIRETIEDLGYSVGQVTLSLGDLQEQQQQQQQADEANNGTQTAIFSISGMTCMYCVRTISEALQKLPGVIPGTVSISLEDRKGSFSFKGGIVDASIIQQVIEQLGYDLNGKPRFRSGRESLDLSAATPVDSQQISIAMTAASESTPMLQEAVAHKGSKKKVVMRVLGMACDSCVASVTDALQHELPNVEPESVHVNIQTEMAMFICTDPDIDLIHNAIEERGFQVENVQIIQNLAPPAVLVAQQQQEPVVERPDSIASLSAISIDTQPVSAPHKVTFQISGMTCASCVRTIERGLVKLPGVDPSTVQVNLLTHSGSFSVHGDMLDEQMIIKAVKNMGYTASKVAFISSAPLEPEPSSGTSTMAVYKAEMIITGMYCPNCIIKVHSSLVKLHGIRSKSIQVHLESGRASFEYTGRFITRQRIYQAILQLGFSAESIRIAKVSNQDSNDAASISSRASSRFVTTHLVVTGMTCSSCVANIERTIIKQAGVVSCQVNLLAKSAVIKHDPTVVGARSLTQMIEQIGYKTELAQDTQGNTIVEQRMSMKESMDKELAVLKARFLWSLLFAIPVVLISMVFMMALPASSPVHRAFMKEIVHGLTVGDLLLFLLSTPVQFWLGLPFYTKAYKSLVYAHTANMETLVAMGTTVAYLASVASVIAAMIRRTAGAISLNYFETSVLLITFIHFGKWLEALAKGKTAETITKLMDLQPEKATLVEISKSASRTSMDDFASAQTSQPAATCTAEKENAIVECEEVLTEREIDSIDIQVGDIVKINAGGRIPCDGKVWRGASATDESMITGESVPVTKKEGDSVITATINLSAPIYIRAIRVGSNTTLSRIIQLVQDAQASPKAPIEQLADHISSVFVPVVILLAVATFIVWEVLSVKNAYPDEWVPMGENKTIFSLMLAVTVLVIACPCGLGLASPTAVMVGTGVAAKYGVLVKGGGYALEMANRITTVAFDKTGTLTMGKPLVTHSWIDQTTEQRLEGNNSEQRIAIWKILGRVGSASNHPLSKSIGKKATHIVRTLQANPSVSDTELISTSADILDHDDSEDNNHDNDVFEGVTITNAQEVPGRGLLATITLSAALAANLTGKLCNVRALNIFLGNQEWMDENHARYQNSSQTKMCRNLLLDWQNLGQSIVLVAASPVSGNDDQEPSGSDMTHKDGCSNACACDVCSCATGSVCCAASQTIMISQLAIADIPRPESAELIAELRKRGIEVWMITGDNERTGRVIGAQLGLPADFVLAGVKPEQKADKIRNLQRRGIRAPYKNKLFLQGWKRSGKKHERAVVAMVGDGINDSPALAQADVGISVGSATDIAIEAASIVLIRNNLMDLLTMYDVSRTVVRRIRFNFFWAFLYNAVAIPIAAGILYPAVGQGLPPYIAGIAMVASSVSVVCSSLLLRLYRAPKPATMKLQLMFLLVVLPAYISAYFATGDGLILYTSDQQTRSGVLSSDHRCTNFPNQFKAAHVKNSGGSHCAMWTDEDCKGTLYVVPAHYTMRMPRAVFKSVIC